MARLFLYALAVVAILAGVPRAHAQPQPARIALLIGNQAYSDQVGPLKNPHNDVALLDAALKQLGFAVTVLRDAGYRDMDTAIKRHIADVRRAGAGALSFFYYSGHGVANPETQINYLIPVDVRDANDPGLWHLSFEQNDIIEKLNRQAPQATHYVVFDACRNELRLTGAGQKALGAEKGFVPVAQTAGLLIAYATAPKQTASDVGDGGGPYAKALASEIVKPGIEAVTMFRNVQLKVKQSIGQDPWLSFPSLPEVYLAGRAAAAVTPPIPTQSAAAVQPAPAARTSDAAEAWSVAEKSTDPAVLEAYIRRFGETFYGDLAKSRLAALRRQDEERARADAARKEAEAAKAADADRQRLASSQRAEEERKSIDQRKADIEPPARAEFRLTELTRLQSGGVDRVFFTGKQLNRAVRIRLRAAYGDVEVKSIEFVFTGGSKSALPIASVVAADQTSRWFKMPAERNIQEMVVSFGKVTGQARLEILGEPVLEEPPVSDSQRTSGRAPSQSNNSGLCVDIALGNGTRQCVTPGSGQTFKDCVDCPEMVVVPAGTFDMGSPEREPERSSDEGPQRRVSIASPLAVGKFEITFAQWDACVADGACTIRADDRNQGRGRRPVSGVSWIVITKEFLPWLSRKGKVTYRLLTEAEWEYAARAGTTTAFAFGQRPTSGSASFDATASYGGSSTVQRAPISAAEVGAYPANAWGIHDMHGNVKEWVQDCWHDSYQPIFPK
ncbi:MAG: SUMF1/EgtB/PvdO family nonheme iron enzyme [Gammaproteobacteria bacterium]|nr:SUMF1/EgtB/PvdO family nonheme iron enzyme [Gammaproteobacteria bacterium]